ncbi:hypothetical protein ACNPQK_08235 [Acinetobacter guillouiae]|uniref:hypothetical protein n=3 Tax=Acinetobacter guillouiae TaxID=106649 RepID=UPI003AF86384
MKKLSVWHVGLARLITGFYFSKIHVIGERASKPTLYIASHRNGATDGQVYTWAIDKTPSLISIQMLRKWFLRLIFDGIAVVRPQDTQRYKISHDSVASPIQLAIQQLSSGGSLCIMPEGSSEWREKPEAYKQGMACIVKQLKLNQIDFVVQSMGVFYTKPDGFRSQVSIVFGSVFMPKESTVDGIFLEMSERLNDVSVNCENVQQFNQIQAMAWNSIKHSEPSIQLESQQHQTQDYGELFLALQSKAKHNDLSVNLAINIEIKKSLNPTRKILNPMIKILFFIGFFPTVLFALLAQKGSDGRNNLTFFRLLGGFYGSILTCILWIVGLFTMPFYSIMIILLGWIGWYFYPEPEPIALSTRSLNKDAID